MKKKFQFLFAVLLHIWFHANPLLLFSQPQEIKDGIEAISRITGNSNTDETSYLLKKIGFVVPESLQSHWNAFPAYRKIESAYWAAEKAGNGEKLLTVLANNLAREYESVPYERSLKKFLGVKINPNEKMKFGSLASSELPKQVPKEIAEPIMSIVKYTDGKALGGVRGILKYNFGLHDDAVYKILRESSSDFEALLSGINQASIPPSQKERIRKIVLELRQSFESANMDSRLSKFLEEPGFLKDIPGTALKSKPPKEKLKAEYDLFIKRTHPTAESKKFSQMKVNPEGFGGVIFGNKITVTKTVGKLKNIVWLHEKNGQGFSPTGSLEFIFNDNVVKVITNVLWEDVYAAYNIVYVDNKNSQFINQEGIGLTGAYYPAIYNEDKEYDSLILSHNLTPTERYFYNFIKARQYIDTLKKLDSIILDLELKLIKSKAKGDRTALNSYYNKYNRHCRVDSVMRGQYRKFINKASSNLLDTSLAKNDSLALKNIIRYLSECNKIVLYPILANLELGRSLIRADVLPRTGTLLIEKIKNKGGSPEQLELCKKWLEGSDTLGWKFTDDSLLISIKGDFLEVARQTNPEELASQYGFLNFNTINFSNGKSTSTDFPEFKQLVPMLTDIFYDYYRLNNFAKLLAIFRWGKQNEAKFLNKPHTPKLYKAPAYSFLTKEASVILIDLND